MVKAKNYPLFQRPSWERAYQRSELAAARLSAGTRGWKLISSVLDIARAQMEWSDIRDLRGRPQHRLELAYLWVCKVS